MPMIIKPEVDFRLTENQIVEVYSKEAKIGELDIPWHAILCLFSGYFDDNQIARILQDALGLSYNQSEMLIRTIVSKFQYILEKTYDQKRDLTPFTQPNGTINLKKIRAFVPQIVVLSITRDCFMRCRYCYAGALYSTSARPEHSLEILLIEKVIKEAKELNISHIDLTGGDPFSRSDIFDILAIFQKNNVRVSFSTKKFLTDYEINTLKDFSNIAEIQISLDSLEDSIQEKLILKPDYSTEMLKVIKNLIAGGIQVKTNSVVTSLNIKSIPELVGFLDKIGVNTCVISPYANNLWRHDPVLFPSYGEYIELNRQLEAMCVNAKLDKPAFLNSLEYHSIYANMHGKTCSAGEDGLVVGPNGSVGICERLIYNEEYSLGNIQDLSLIEIWNSKRLKEFYLPAKEKFHGTTCYTCESLDYCINERGICHVHSIILNHRIFSPDHNCKYCSGNVRIF